MKVQTKTLEDIITVSRDRLAEVYLYDSFGNEFHKGKFINIT